MSATPVAARPPHHPRGDAAVYAIREHAGALANARHAVRLAAADRPGLAATLALADLPGGPTPLRVAGAEGGLACLVQVWPAGTLMPAVAAERRRRVSGARTRCRADVLEIVRRAGRAVTRKEVIRALRATGLAHGPGTVGKALADLTAAGELVNPRDKRGYRLPDRPRRHLTQSLF